ncbi:MAG: signal recognition particle-docking protein FtsY [Desulfovibrionaceae bacterium]|nr:signal recognition particle-docking protein FtsY [Desulfovibrionaceae bacterium]
MAPEAEAEASEAAAEPEAQPEPESAEETAPEAEAEASEDAAEPEAQPEPETAEETAPEAEAVASEAAAEPEAQTEPETAEEAPVTAAAGQPVQPQKSGGFFASLKRFFGGGAETAPETVKVEAAPEPQEERYGGLPQEKPTARRAESGSVAAVPSEKEAFYGELTTRLREADSKLSVWLDIVLEGVTEAGPELNERISFLLRSLEAPASEVEEFVSDFSGWLERMEYRQLDEFRSELQYRLSLALDLEDEEDERSRLLIKLSDSLAKTRAHFARQLDSLISSHGELDEEFWEELEELFIMSDLGVEASVELTRRLRERARTEKVTTTEGARELLRQEIREIFVRPRHIVGVTPPEVVLMIGVNGAGKTTTIAKLAYRDRMQGKKVMIAAADTFRAAAIDQMRVWADRVGTLFHAKQPGSDPASVAYEAMDRALAEGVDVLYVDTAGRLQTKTNLMDELAKIRNVIARKHPGAPHRTVLILDATTGQNALSQAKLFKESAGVDELILTKLDGTAKGGVAIAVAMQHQLPITYIGLGEKVEDLRPFNGDDYADALFNG